jgi:hypothetical protein
VAARFPTTRWSRVIRAAVRPTPVPGPRSKNSAAITGFLRVLERLENASARAGHEVLFARLRPVLQGDNLAPSYAAIGAELGMSDGAVRVAAHRLRARYRELLREEVGRTTDDPIAIDSEIADLLATLASH